MSLILIIRRVGLWESSSVFKCHGFCFLTGNQSTKLAERLIVVMYDSFKFISTSADQDYVICMYYSFYMLSSMGLSHSLFPWRTATVYIVVQSYATVWVFISTSQSATLITKSSSVLNAMVFIFSQEINKPNLQNVSL